MNFSCKIKKFCDGMFVYDHLLEDEGAIHIPFALSFYVTITTIVGQLKQFLIDLKNHVCHEIPDINIEQMDVDKIMSPKFKRDMEGFGNITMRELLEKQFGPFLDKTPLEFFCAIRDHIVLMVQYVVEIRKVLDNSKPELFGKYICRRIKEGNYDDVKENYAKWKKRHAEVTMEMLLAKQEQMLKTYLDKGIMRFEDSPTNKMMKIVDYDYHTAHLDCDFRETEEYKKAYTKLMGYAIRNEGMLCINYNKYGKYVFNNYDKFSEGQKPALLELCVILDLIQEDMKELMSHEVNPVPMIQAMASAVEQTVAQGYWWASTAWAVVYRVYQMKGYTGSISQFVREVEEWPWQKKPAYECNYDAVCKPIRSGRLAGTPDGWVRNGASSQYAVLGQELLNEFQKVELQLQK